MIRCAPNLYFLVCIYKYKNSNIEYSSSINIFFSIKRRK